MTCIRGAQWQQDGGGGVGIFAAGNGRDPPPADLQVRAARGQRDVSPAATE